MRVRFFAAIALATSMVMPLPGQAQTETPAPDQVMKPELERRSVKAPRIEVDDFEAVIVGGLLSVEDFGSRPIYGIRLGYHVTEDFFVEGTYALSTVSDDAYRNIGRAIFLNPKEDLTTYDLSVGVNLFPGEIFVGKSWATTSVVYLIGGVGNTNFANQDFVTFNVGMGLRVQTADWFSLRLEMRDLMWESNLLGASEIKHNFAMTLGASFLF